MERIRLNGEIGEVVEPLLELVVHGSKASELVKKQVRGSKPVDVVALKLELGDVIHYATVLANAFGLTLEDILLGNVAKLEARELKNHREQQLQNVANISGAA